jgi:hypothetical protein
MERHTTYSPEIHSLVGYISAGNLPLAQEPAEGGAYQHCAGSRA